MEIATPGIKAALRRARLKMGPVRAARRAEADVIRHGKRKGESWNYPDPDELRAAVWAVLAEQGLEVEVSEWEVRVRSDAHAAQLEVHFAITLFEQGEPVEETTRSVSITVDPSGAVSTTHAELAALTHAETRFLINLLRVEIVGRKATTGEEAPQNPNIKSRPGAAPRAVHPNFVDPNNLPPPDVWEPEPDDDLPEDFGAAEDFGAVADEAGDEEQAEPVTRAEVADRWRALQEAGCSQPWAKFVEGAVGRQPPIVDEDLPKLAQAIDELLELAASQRAAVEEGAR